MFAEGVSLGLLTWPFLPVMPQWINSMDTNKGYEPTTISKSNAVKQLNLLNFKWKIKLLKFSSFNKEEYMIPVNHCFSYKREMNIMFYQTKNNCDMM